MVAVRGRAARAAFGASRRPPRVRTPLKEVPDAVVELLAEMVKANPKAMLVVFRRSWTVETVQSCEAFGKIIGRGEAWTFYGNPRCLKVVTRRTHFRCRGTKRKKTSGVTYPSKN